MALTQAFTTENTVITVNGRIITNWGTTEPPIQEEPIDPKRTLVRGLGGNGVVLERKNNGKRVTLHLMPGSDDSAYLMGLYNSGAIITYTRSHITAIDGTVCSEGVMINEPQVGRGGAGQIGDDTFVIEFNVNASSRGGDL